MAVMETTECVVDPVTCALWEVQGREGILDELSCWHVRWTRATIEETVARVNRGALLLDAEKPGWMEAVVPAHLQMQDTSWCIIGQVYGDYDQFVGVPFGLVSQEHAEAYTDIKVAVNACDQALEHGFFTTSDDDAKVPWMLLDRVWVYLLSERSRAGGAPLTLRLPEQEPITITYERVRDLELVEA